MSLKFYAKQMGAISALAACFHISAQPALVSNVTSGPPASVPAATIHPNHTPHPFGGRFGIFTSQADNLVPNDTNRVRDVFLSDAQTNTITRLSVDRQGRQIPQGSWAQQVPLVTPDGRFALFQSSAQVVGGTVGPNFFQAEGFRLYWKDLQNNIIRWVDDPAHGLQGARGSGPTGVGLFDMSSDGSLVVFTSTLPPSPGAPRQYEPMIFIRDMNAGITRRIRSGADPSISADGRFVAFSLQGSGAVEGDTNNSTDVFIRDTRSGSTSRVSVNSDGIEGNGHSRRPAISSNGRLVAFYSNATNLVPAAPADPRRVHVGYDIFLRDLAQGTTQAVSLHLSSLTTSYRRFRLPPSGGQHLSFSPDGRFLLFNAHVIDNRVFESHTYVVLFEVATGALRPGPRIVWHR